MSDADKPFRFRSFADAPSAQAAFEAVYPPGSAIEPALQALVDMGAHCKATAQNRFACRHVAIESDAQRAIQRVGVSLSILGV